jgi:hypothetical protein
MSSFTPLTRKEPVNDKLRSDSADFTPLTHQDKTPSFSYSFERISKAGKGLSFKESTAKNEDVADSTVDTELTPMVRALSFAHKAVGSLDKSSVDSIKAPVAKDGNGRIVAVVDTFSTGAFIVDSLIRQGFRVIRVLSGDLNPELLDMVLEGLATSFIATVTFNTKIEDTNEAMDNLIAQINSIQLDGSIVSSMVEAVIAGAETGVELADALSERLSLRTNGTSMSEARRNKFIMGEVVRSAGIRAVKQIKASSWQEVNAFLDEWRPEPFKVIVKPLDSAGSDGVTLCLSRESVS